MIEAHFGSTGPAPAHGPSKGDDTAGPGAAPGVRAPSSPPSTSTPDTIRAILAGISSPAPQAPTLTVVRPAEEAPPPAESEVRPPLPAAETAPAPEDPGALTLASVDAVLPHIVESARAAGRQLTVVVARPGPAATPGVRLAPASPGTVADLAAALAVSLDPEQDLLADGPGHLVVTSLGGSARRDTTALMQRTAEAGAPMFTWAAARFPRDAQSPGALLDLARARVDGTEPVAERERRRVAAMVWAGAAAALLVAAFAFIAHGHGVPRASGSAGGHGATHTGALSGSGATGGSVSGGSGSGASGPRGTGGSGSGSANGGGTGSSGTGGGVSGTGTSPGNTGGTGSSGTGGGSTATTTPSNGGNTTATTTGNTTGTTTANTTGTTTVNSTSPTTTTTVCSYNLLGQLICTVNGLLGGH